MATEYIIVTGSRSEVERDVEANLGHGWELSGGVTEYDGGFAQAMVCKPKMSQSLLEDADLEIKRLRLWLERIRTNPECESTVEMAMKALAGERIKP